MKEDIKKLKSIAEDLFSFLGVSVALDLSETQDNGVLLNIETGENKGLLIGRKGENLSAVRFFLQLAFYKQTGKWMNIKVTSGDWLKKQEEYLLPLARRAAEKAKETGQPQHLYNLNSEQRRIVHLAISRINGVISESIGEGRERCLVIKTDAQKGNTNSF